MITLKQLQDFMPIVQEASNQLNKERMLYEQLFEDFDGYSKGLTNILDGFVDTLDKYLGDNSWVSWYAFENDFGAAGLNGISTVEGLYEAILKDSNVAD